ncbi:hypothetical protein [Pedobacter aquatilis]|uniref:hypothetical protein n=1 Tax=Pedobacter aquatilis TaxID=351343 RepID=UPI00292EF269|nr:hypothetical protein [Pedobacter aquatilis]
MAIEKFDLSAMTNGWFIGDFEPSLHRTQDFEVGLKRYKKGDYDSIHYHKIATEFTVIVNGKVEMNGIQYNDGDIIKIMPDTPTNFKALTDVVTVVVKIPGASNDKYLLK